MRNSFLTGDKSLSVDWIKSQPIAHRGLHNIDQGRPENSLSACAAAIEHNYHIEVDLHPALDGEVMVFHDTNLSRLTGQDANIRTLESAHLQTIQLTGSNDKIPTLKQLLALVDGRVGMVLELKAIPGEDEGFITALIQTIAGYEGPLAVMSFDQALLEEAQQLDCPVPLGLTAMGSDRTYDLHKNFLDQHSMAFISYQQEALPVRLTREFRDQGKPVICWTIRNQEEANRALDYCDQITFEGYFPDG